MTSPGLLESLPQSNQTGNSLETKKGIDFVKDIKPHSNKENNDENNNLSNTCITSIKSQLELVRKEKHDIYLKQKCLEYISKEKNDKANNNETPGNFKHPWPAGTCLIVGDSILTGIDDTWLSRNNQVVKVQDCRGATIDGLKHILSLCLKKTWTHNTAYWNEWCSFKNVQTDSWWVISTEAIHHKYITNLQSDCFQTSDLHW